MTAPARTQTAQQPRYLTLAEASELLRTPESTLRWWRHKGIGPPSFRLGRRVLYDRADVEAHITRLRNANQSHDSR